MGKFLDSILHGGSKPSVPSEGTPPPMPSAVPQGVMDPMLAAAMGQQPQQPSQPPQPVDNALADIYSPSLGQPGQPPAMPDNQYTPMDNPQAPSLAPQAAAASVGTPDAIPVVGDGWKPKKESKLGRFMDTMLQMDGHQPIFQQRTDEANLKEAMKDIQKDDGSGPDEQKLINRVRMFNAGLAEEMQGKHDIQDRQNRSLDRQDKVFDLKESEIYRDRVAARLNGATAETYPHLLEMSKRYLERSGHPEIAEELPDTYDKYDVNSFVLGEVPVKDQMKMGETVAHHVATETQAATNEEGRNDRNTTNEAGRNDRNAVNEAGREDRHETPAAKSQPRSLMTKYGPGVINKDNTQMLVTRGGKHYLYINTGKKGVQTNWTPAGEVEVTP